MEENKIEEKKDNFLDKILEFVFDPKKRVIFLIVFFGFILRIIAARNIGTAADDVNHAIRPWGIFVSDKLAMWDQSTILWYYIQGIFYKLFGLTQIASRFASVLFGVATICVVFVFVKRFFRSEKAAIVSSTLVAVSPLLIRTTLPEMDIAVGFFLILSTYFLFKFFESKSKKDLILLSLAIGIGIMIKLYFAFFAVSFFILIVGKSLRTHESKKELMKNLGIFCFILFVFSLPTITHNYLLYKDKGFTDLIFTNTFKIGVDKAKNYYDWSAGWLPSSDYKGFFFGNQKNFDPTPIPGFLVVLSFLFKGDPLIFILGILGLVLTLKFNRKYFYFFLITFVPAFIYLGAQIPMTKHFIWSLVLLAPPAGICCERFISTVKRKIRLRYLLIFIMIFSIIWLGMPRSSSHSSFYGESPFGKLVDYKNEKIESDTLVVVDSRIYRGTIHWGLAKTNYIEAGQFFQVAQELNTQGNLQQIEVYYVECVVDDCGWGTVAKQPEFNQSMEEVTQFFANKSQTKIDFSGPSEKRYYFPLLFGEKVTMFRIYKTTLNLNPLIFSAAKQTHTWWLIPEEYNRHISPIFDDYSVEGADNLLKDLSWVVLYLELIIALIFLVYGIGILFKELK